MKLVQVAQHVDDLERATDFYRELLGAEPIGVFDPPGLVFFDLEGVRLLLEATAPSAILYLEVPDAVAAVERMRGSVEIVEEPHVLFSHHDDALGPADTDEWQAFLRDTEGNLVGLVSFRESATV